MSADAISAFSEELYELVKKSKVLVVGAGGIGCELLKNLVLTGFEDIEIIDLDTIDVSNLNRQFLFQKKHVGKSKAQVAKESVLQYNPNAKIVANHASIMSKDYGVKYFEQFTMVLNALDNQAARNHVNRLCLASGVPLVDSGTAGYNGQVELISKGLTQCYECDPKPPQKSFPGCTIRNTPTEPIHCIVWAKHLFNQLFGEFDPDEDVSPDTADPEAVGEAGEQALAGKANDVGNVERVSTRLWAKSHNYNTDKLFSKLFHDDIKYLLSMSNLWKTRKPPTPLVKDKLPELAGSSGAVSGMKDQRVWTIAECVDVFSRSVTNLYNRFKTLPEGDNLVWDKDDKDSMDFVTACANIRACAFGIPLKSRFDIKSMAGNIIPAIATSNAIIAAIVVLHALKVLQRKFDKCQAVYLRQLPNHKGQVIVPEKFLTKPNPSCRVCSPHATVYLWCDLNTLTCREVENEVLKQELNMVAPDLILNSNIIISSEEGETDHNMDKTLQELGAADGSIGEADDFLQNYSLKIIFCQKDIKKGTDKKFMLVGDIEKLKAEVAKKEEEKKKKDNGDGPSKSQEEEKDDDVIMTDDFEEEETETEGRKRPIDETKDAVPSKKRKTFGKVLSVPDEDPDDGVIVV